MMEEIKGAINKGIRSFLDLKELMNSKMGRIMVSGPYYLQLSFIET
jgi:hypothetical protein